MICASEQVVVIDKEIYKDVTNEFKAHQAYFVKKMNYNAQKMQL